MRIIVKKVYKKTYIYEETSVIKLEKFLKKNLITAYPKIDIEEFEFAYLWFKKT